MKKIDSAKLFELRRARANYPQYIANDYDAPKIAVRGVLRNGKSWRVYAGTGRKQFIVLSRTKRYSFIVDKIARDMDDARLSIMPKQNAVRVHDITRFIYTRGVNVPYANNTDADIYDAGTSELRELFRYRLACIRMSRADSNKRAFINADSTTFTPDEYRVQRDLLMHRRPRAYVSRVLGLADIVNGVLTPKLIK